MEDSHGEKTVQRGPGLDEQDETPKQQEGGFKDYTVSGLLDGLLTTANISPANLPVRRPLGLDVEHNLVDLFYCQRCSSASHDHLIRAIHDKIHQLCKRLLNTGWVQKRCQQFLPLVHLPFHWQVCRQLSCLRLDQHFRYSNHQNYPKDFPGAHPTYGDLAF